ncbi:putative disease resistance protein RGA4 [Pistacia vera]|uniref:putative disease resistance protein RGA4 n=1 Tax=Pistacia vera TaxID=55513 RepID=UPI0012635921|nr:putative disease resistance protein RGA4 [Pistacia vera]
MAEALVSIALEQLASFIRQQVTEGISLIVGAEKKDKKLQSNLRAIQAVLADAENRQVKEIVVRDWLDKLKDVSYDIDDVLDEWKTKFLKLQIKRAKHASKPLKKDYKIKREQLIKLWMAQGYLKSKSNKDMELVGEEYFETLSMRSFFQDFQKDEDDIDIHFCKMHDIVHDFAQFLTKNECYTIEVDGLGNLRDVDEVKGIELNNKNNLRDLGVNFNGRMNVEQNQELLEELQSHPNLEILWLQNYSGNTIFPNWMISLANLRMLVLVDCINCEYLPHLGKLSSLEILNIWRMNCVKRVGNEFLGIESDVMPSSTSIIVFPKLKLLSFREMKEWEEWNFESTKRGDEDITVMPSLQTLKLQSCLKLKSLPNHIYQKTTMKILIDEYPVL